MGHGEHLRFGIMYYLFWWLMKNCKGYTMYDTFLGNSEGLTYFKKKLGFREYNVNWTVK
jgi:hypothetical protein